MHKFEVSEKNKRYYAPENQTIDNKEDISYEMTVHNKIYEATFFQLPKDYKVPSIISVEDAEKATKAFEPAFKKPVWFRICENYGKYHIAMFYDNEYNRADGEDL